VVTIERRDFKAKTKTLQIWGCSVGAGPQVISKERPRGLTFKLPKGQRSCADPCARDVFGAFNGKFAGT